MIKIEVTGTTLGEVADKLLAIGGSLLATDHKRIYEKGARAEARAIAADPSLLHPPEVAEAAPVNPTPEAPIGEAAPLAEPVTEPAAPEPTTSAPSAEASASELNFDTDVAPYVLQVVKEKGKPVAQEILSQFGVEKASLLEPHLWPELVDQLKGAL